MIVVLKIIFSITVTCMNHEFVTIARACLIFSNKGDSYINKWCEINPDFGFWIFSCKIRISDFQIQISNFRI
jgi:hypothetical protein